MTRPRELLKVTAREDFRSPKTSSTSVSDCRIGNIILDDAHDSVKAAEV